MAFSLAGKNTLITGGTSGIGLGVAKRFIADGANVVISGRRESGKTIAEDIGARFIQADLSVDDQMVNLFEQAQSLLGPLAIVINNAGMSEGLDLIVKQSMANFDHCLNVNLRAAYRVVQLAGQYLQAGGTVINTASIAAFEGNAFGSTYNLSKAALVSLTKSAAIEFAPKNIRVNAVSPGLIHSEIWGGQTPTKIARAQVPMQRVGEADEAAAVFHFLASDEASYVTGANYLVDGGYIAGGPMARHKGNND